MAHPAIQIQNISKRYFIGGDQRPSTRLYDAIGEAFQRFGRIIRNPFAAFSETSEHEFWALRDVSFDIPMGGCVGIIGSNGAGKSTLLKILSRITSPTAGRISIHGRVASLLEVGTGFHPELTGRENVFLNGAILGMKRREIERKFDDIVAFSEVEQFLDTPVKRYSSGMYVRLAFAVAAFLEPEILLVDEVLAVGDAAFQKKCLGKMGTVAKQGRTILFVSHNMPAITQLCDSAVLLERGKVSAIGSSRDVVHAYLKGTQEVKPSSIFPRKNGVPLQFSGVAVRDMRGQVATLLPDSEEFSVEVDVGVYEVVTDVYFGLILRNSEGLNILFSDSRDREEAIPARLSPGNYRFVLRFPPVFIPDKFSITLGMAHSITLQQFDYIESACSFELVQSENIQRTSSRVGILNLRLKWDQKTLE